MVAFGTLGTSVDRVSASRYWSGATPQAPPAWEVGTRVARVRGGGLPSRLNVLLPCASVRSWVSRTFKSFLTLHTLR